MKTNKFDHTVTNQLRKGNRVTVYQQPIDQKDREGVAQLIKEAPGYPFKVDGSVFEYWMVKFPEDTGTVFMRCVSIRDVI